MIRSTLLALAIAAAALHGQTVDGAAVYARHCARCHSGYGFFGGAAGNVLLALTADGK